MFKILALSTFVACAIWAPAVITTLATGIVVATTTLALAVGHAITILV